MKVVEIFNSIEGEGKRIGKPSTFIRLHGCNLNCSYCDSRYACTGTDYEVMGVGEILQEVDKIGCKCVTLTGGEPLIHPGVESLIQELVLAGYEVNVETNGTVDPTQRSAFGINLFYTFDFKSTGSGMKDKMNPEVFKNIKSYDVLKFVVASEEEMNEALEVVEKYQIPCRVYVSPVFGEIEPREIVTFIQMHKLWNWTVQVQLHKIIYDPDARGV